MKTCTIIMYHYVRELPFTRYPKIKGLLVSQFKEQLDYLSRHYEFVTIGDCLKAIYEDADLPSNAVLLTFDDGYSDHFENVFPILKERKIQGCFFPQAKAVQERNVLDVNKIHFVLASTDDPAKMKQEIFSLMDELRSKYNLASQEEYYAKYAIDDRFDTKDILFIKLLLQKGLPEGARQEIANRLFKKYVSVDEKAFANELYMSMEQLQCMYHEGMSIGSHGYSHIWMSTVSAKEQEKDVDMSLQFLKQLGVNGHPWVMCYPFGSYNDSLISILKKRNCGLALTIKVDIANLTPANALTLERLDTNDIPKNGKAEINHWTQKVLKDKESAIL